MSAAAQAEALLWRLHEVDEAVHLAVSAWHAPALDRVLPGLSEAASYSRLWMGVAGVVAVSGGARGRRAAVRGLASVAVTSFTVNVLAKGIANRPRPRHEVPAARRLELPSSTSFPSGHSASAAAFSAAVGRELPPLRGPVNALAGAVAFSRVYVGVHYPGDVLAGWILGRAIAHSVARVADARADAGRA